MQHATTTQNELQAKHQQRLQEYTVVIYVKNDCPHCEELLKFLQSEPESLPKETHVTNVEEENPGVEMWMKVLGEDIMHPVIFVRGKNIDGVEELKQELCQPIGPASPIVNNWMKDGVAPKLGTDTKLGKQWTSII